MIRALLIRPGGLYRAVRAQDSGDDRGGDDRGGDDRTEPMTGALRDRGSSSMRVGGRENVYGNDLAEMDAIGWNLTSRPSAPPLSRVSGRTHAAAPYPHWLFVCAADPAGPSITRADLGCVRPGFACKALRPEGRGNALLSSRGWRIWKGKRCLRAHAAGAWARRQVLRTLAVQRRARLRRSAPRPNIPAPSNASEAGSGVEVGLGGACWLTKPIRFSSKGCDPS